MPPAPPLILASASPRRQTIFRAFGVPFGIVVPRVEENLDGGEPAAVALALARAKAADVAVRLGLAGAPPFVVGADTIVASDGEILGKPADRRDAERMIRMLLGREHRVLTGVCVLGGTREADAFVETTYVRFRNAGAAAVSACLDAGEWSDKAGAYAIQGAAATLVAAIRGEFWNVVGFPALAFLARAGRLGIPGLDERRAREALSSMEPSWVCRS